jgi:hypothetical protein
MRIALETSGADELGLLLSEISNRSRFLNPVFSEIADDFNLVERAAFGGNPDLVRTGDVRAALIGRAEGSVREIGLDEMSVGTDIWYSQFHSDRLLEPITPLVERRWAEAIAGFIVGDRAQSSFIGGMFGL